MATVGVKELLKSMFHRFCQVKEVSHGHQ